MCEGETEKTDVKDKAPPCTVGHSLALHCFHFSITPFSFLCFLLATSQSISLELLRQDLVPPWTVGTEEQPS